MKHLVILDWDGVIADSCSTYFNLYREIALNFGKTFPLRTIEEFRDWYDSAWENNFLSLGFTKEEVSEAKKYQFEHIHYDTIPLFPSIKKVLEELSRCYLLAIASTTDSSLIRKKLSMESMDSLFSHVSGGEGGTSDKRSIISRSVEALHMNREDVVMIGDTVMDIISSRALGVKSIAVTYGWHPEARLKEASPDNLARTGEEIIPLVNGIFRSCPDD